MFFYKLNLLFDNSDNLTFNAVLAFKYLQICQIITFNFKVHDLTLMNLYIYTANTFTATKQRVKRLPKAKNNT